MDASQRVKGPGGRPRAARCWLTAGVAANLALLGWFKHANFLVQGVLRLRTPELDIFRPLAISFFTFRQRMRSRPLSRDSA